MKCAVGGGGWRRYTARAHRYARESAAAAAAAGWLPPGAAGGGWVRGCAAGDTTPAAASRQVSEARAPAATARRARAASVVCGWLGLPGARRWRARLRRALFHGRRVGARQQCARARGVGCACGDGGWGLAAATHLRSFPPSTLTCLPHPNHPYPAG